MVQEAISGLGHWRHGVAKKAVTPSLGERSDGWSSVKGSKSPRLMPHLV